jgi:hypothetical protein
MKPVPPFVAQLSVGMLGESLERFHLASMGLIPGRMTR